MIHIQVSKKRNYIGAAIVVSLLAFAVIVPQLKVQHADAVGETIIAGSPIGARVNEQASITGISIGGTGNDTVPVELQVGDGTLYMSTTTGLTFTS